MLATGSRRVEEPVSSVVCGWSLVDGGNVPPAASIALLLDVAPLMICFTGTIVDVRLFEEGFGLLGVDFECRNSDLNESTNLWWRLSNVIDRAVNLAPQMNGGLTRWE